MIVLETIRDIEPSGVVNSVNRKGPSTEPCEIQYFKTDLHRTELIGTD